MITKDGPKTIEFNARFGDPETQVVLPRLETDLLDIFLASINGTLDRIDIKWSNDVAVCVVLASGGYPGFYPKGFPIEGLKDVATPGALVFHAGTALKDGQVVTNGGRVLGIVGRGAGIAEARANAYNAAEGITFQGKQNRTDIAAKALI
jgi:phosphoribosylamine--glycine ligase